MTLLPVFAGPVVGQVALRGLPAHPLLPPWVRTSVFWSFVFWLFFAMTVVPPAAGLWHALRDPKSLLRQAVPVPGPQRPGTAPLAYTKASARAFGSSPVCSTPSRWVARVRATYRSLVP
ncbi:hypothetical protein [Streptomyces sp. NPDC002788]